MRKFKKNKESGFMGMDAMGTLLFSLIMLAGAGLLVAQLFAGSKVAEVQQAVSTMRMNIQQMYISSTDYTGIDNTAVIAGGAVPAKLVDSSALITSPWGDAITIAAGTDPKTFTIAIANLPQEAAVKLSKYQPESWDNIQVGDTSTMDLTVQGASALCTGDGLTVTFTGR